MANHSLWRIQLVNDMTERKRNSLASIMVHLVFNVKTAVAKRLNTQNIGSIKASTTEQSHTQSHQILKKNSNLTKTVEAVE